MAPTDNTSSSSFSCSSITQINQDHLISILQLLPFDSILAFSMTCTAFRSLASLDPLWEAVCRRDWGTVRVSALLASLSAQEKRRLGWKRLYKQIWTLSPLGCFRVGGRDAAFPHPRASHSLNWVSDYLVLFGGGCQGGRHLGDTWVAYIGNGRKRTVRWQHVKSVGPSGRFGHTCIAVGPFLVLFGGIDDNGIRQNDTWVGQITQDGLPEKRLAWRPLQVGPVAPGPRGAHAGCNIGDNMMVIHGGIGPNGDRLDDLWLLDVSDDYHSGRWQLITTTKPSPPARSGHSLTWIGGKCMVLFGGRSMGFDVLNDVWIFDLGVEFPEWSMVKYQYSNALDRLPRPRVGHSAVFVIGGRVLVHGGEDSFRERIDGDFWLLDVSALPAPKANVSVVDSKVVMGKMWRRLKAEGQKPECRSFHTACVDKTGRRFYIFGGMVDGVNPAQADGMRFDCELYLLEILLQL